MTKFHDQGDTNLCHSYAVLSGFRIILQNFFRTEIQDTATRDAVLKNFKPTEHSNFYKMMAVFIGCINPRSFDGLFKVRVENKKAMIKNS